MPFRVLRLQKVHGGGIEPKKKSGRRRCVALEVVPPPPPPPPLPRSELVHNTSTRLTSLTCSLSGLVKVVHQNREQNTKAESHAKINWMTNRCWNTHDPWPRTILETLSSEEPRYFTKTLRGVLFFYHFNHPKYRPNYFAVDFYVAMRNNPSSIYVPENIIRKVEFSTCKHRLNTLMMII